LSSGTKLKTNDLEHNPMSMSLSRLTFGHCHFDSIKNKKIPNPMSAVILSIAVFPTPYGTENKYCKLPAELIFTIKPSP